LLLLRILAILAAALVALPAPARHLYAATAHLDPKNGESAGQLYVINPETGRSKLIGPIRVDGGGAALAIDGLAVHPKTGALYGITWRSSPEPSLIIIDPHSAAAKRIGPLGVRGTDIHFDGSGTLYIWIAESHRLGTVSLETGAVTLLPPTQISGAGGLAISPQGLAIVAGSTNGGIIDEVDVETGDLVGGVSVINNSVLNAVYALTYMPTRSLLAVNQVKGRERGRELVSIDPESGNVTRIGALPDEVDAIAFDDSPGRPTGSKAGLLGYFVVILSGLAIADTLRWRRK
jgi:hypothetical protein